MGKRAHHHERFTVKLIHLSKDRLRETRIPQGDLRKDQIGREQHIPENGSKVITSLRVSHDETGEGDSSPDIIFVLVQSSPFATLLLLSFSSLKIPIILSTSGKSRYAFHAPNRKRA
jgi:hypothetical protein